MIDLFPPNHVSATLAQVDAAPAGDWPEVNLLVILFTSRSGSTHLGREITRRFEIGRIGESLGAPRLDREGGGAEALKRIIAVDVENGWFGLKTGVGGLIVGEAMGFLPAARARTVFILLLRRDIVAQAVSIAKARQTGRWLSSAPASPTAQPTFTNAGIAEQIAVVGTATPILQRYLDRVERPWLPLAYEDFQGEDKSPVGRICGALGLSPRDQPVLLSRPPVERTYDAVNADWVERFRPDAPTAAIIERHRQFVAAIAPPGARG